MKFEVGRWYRPKEEFMPRIRSLTYSKAFLVWCDQKARKCANQYYQSDYRYERPVQKATFFKNGDSGNLTAVAQYEKSSEWFEEVSPDGLVDNKQFLLF